MTQKQHEALKDAVMILASDAGLSHKIGILLNKANEPQLNKPDVSGSLPLHQIFKYAQMMNYEDFVIHVNELLGGNDR